MHIVVCSLYMLMHFVKYMYMYVDVTIREYELSAIGLLQVGRIPFHMIPSRMLSHDERQMILLFDCRGVHVCNWDGDWEVSRVKWEEPKNGLIFSWAPLDKHRLALFEHNSEEILFLDYKYD